MTLVTQLEETSRLAVQRRWEYFMSIRNARRALILAAAALAACSSEYADTGTQSMTPAATGSAGSRPTAAQPAAGTGMAARPTTPPATTAPAANSGNMGRAGTSAPATTPTTAANGGASGAGSTPPGATAGAGAAGSGTSSATAGSVATVGGSSAGSAGSGGSGSTPSAGAGMCCDDGDCLCHGPAPSELTAGAGPYKVERARVTSGTLHYPTDAEPPLAAVVLCGGFLNTGPEMDSWGPMYASHGIVTVIVTTDGADIPEIRATRLLAAIDELKMLNGDSSSPLSGKLSGRYGTSGYSMGGGGTTIASGQNAEVKTSIGLAPWGGSGNNVKAATL
ncbi:MAG TPA: hypothetical protein VMF89_33690, partial [Polyangiales bacterium]|nr:hypothetical protein [Polyangiales bacterium]